MARRELLVLKSQTGIFKRVEKDGVLSLQVNSSNPWFEEKITSLQERLFKDLQGGMTVTSDCASRHLFLFICSPGTFYPRIHAWRMHAQA